VWYVTEPLLSQLQAIKGAVEVILTASLIFILTSSRESHLQAGLSHLRRQREQLQVLHRVLRHNLRNDLTAIGMRVEMLRDAADSEYAVDHYNRILKVIDEMVGYANQAGIISQFTQCDGKIEYDATETVSQIIEEECPTNSDEVEVTASVPDQAMIETVPGFQDAIREVVNNAIEHNDGDDLHITVDVSHNDSQPEYAEIQVSDNGCGISPDEYRPVEIGLEEQLQHTSGLGLWLVRWAVQYSDGEMSVEHNEDKGTTMSLRVPIASD